MRGSWTLAGLALVASTGCTKLFGLDPPRLREGDAAIDAPQVDVRYSAESSCKSFSTEVNTCQLDFSQAGALDVSDNSIYNSDTHTLMIGNTVVTPAHMEVTGPAGPIEVVLSTTFTVDNNDTLTVVGSLPVAFVSTDAVMIVGTVNVGAGTRGFTDCLLQAGQLGTSNGNGGGGGGGGAYQGNGGKGGVGDLANTASGPGGVGVAAVGLLGGCPGGTGGDGEQPGALGGAGGGAIDFSSMVSFEQNGDINAGGQGGVGGRQSAGGGGGGSGGMIVIEAPTVMITGKLAANGGGGGQGGATTQTGQNGNPGDYGTNVARGGNNGMNGGAGGDGATRLTNNGNDAATNALHGGGGGGGGVGYIGLVSATPTTGSATISPTVTPWPP